MYKSKTSSHDENYTAFVILLLVHEMGGGGELTRGGESEYFKFRLIRGAIVRREHLFEVKGTLIRRFKVITACVLRRQKDVNTVLREILLKNIADSLCVKGSRFAHLYGLPKTHKANLSMRPILSATGTYNYNLAKWWKKHSSHSL